MEYAVFDIETVPIEFEDKTIIEYLMDKKTYRSLHPFFSKIIAIGLQYGKHDPKIFYGENEKELIELSNQGYECQQIGNNKWLMRRKIIW